MDERERLLRGLLERALARAGITEPGAYMDEVGGVAELLKSLEHPAGLGVVDGKVGLEGKVRWFEYRSRTGKLTVVVDVVSSELGGLENGAGVRLVI